MMKLCRDISFLCFIVALCCRLTSAAQEIHSELPADSLLNVVGLAEEDYAIYIEDIMSGEVIADHNGDIPMTPASVTKAVTAAAVLSAFSPETRFATVVRTDGHVADSTLYGNIIIECYGDPTIASPFFPDTDICSEIAGALRARHIKRIEGAVIVEQSSRVDEPAPAGWMTSDLDKKYGAVHRTCNYGANLFTVSLPSGRTSPAVPDLAIDDMTSRRGKFAVSKSGHTNRFTLSGKRPSHGDVSGVYPNSSPHLTLAAETVARLDAAGIGITSDTATVAAPSTDIILVHHSPTFAEIMRSMMVRSDNMIAEAMLRTLSPRGTRADALASERHLLSDVTEEWRNATLEDGSGLSRRNRYPAFFLADILLHMARSEQGVRYASLFPRAGIEGTVKSLFADTPLRGRLALKSGSMNGVQCYAGYILDSEGFPEKVIVVMINNYYGDRRTLRKAIEDFLTMYDNIC